VRPADRPESVAAWRAEMNAPEPAPVETDAIDPTRIERTVFVSPAPGTKLADNAARDAEAYATTAPAAGPAHFSDAYARTMPDPFKAKREAARAGAGAAATDSVSAAEAAFQASRFDRAAEPDSTTWSRVLRHPVWLGLVVLVVFATLVTAFKRGHHAATDVAAVSTMSPTLSNKKPADSKASKRDSADDSRADDAAGNAMAHTKTSDRGNERAQARAAKREAEASEPSRGSPADACGGRIFLSRVFCMKRECAKAEFTQHPQCVKLRQQEEANRPHAP
jgi:hypothetical protein